MWLLDSFVEMSGCYAWLEWVFPRVDGMVSFLRVELVVG